MPKKEKREIEKQPEASTTETATVPPGDLEPLASKLVQTYRIRASHYTNGMKKQVKSVKEVVLEARRRQTDAQGKDGAEQEDINWSDVLRTLGELKETLDTAESSVQNIHRWQVETNDLGAVGPEGLDWGLLDSAFAEDAPRALAAWERLKQTASAEWNDGDRALRSLVGNTPWERAQFLALWVSIRDEVKPSGGVEYALVDSMALAFTQHLAWLTTADNLRVYEARAEQQSIDKSNRWEPPRVATADWVRLSVEMADRYQRMFIRAARTLKDLRRATPSVVVGAAGQVNVGAQQVNVAEVGDRLEQGRGSS